MDWHDLLQALAPWGFIRSNLYPFEAWRREDRARVRCHPGNPMTVEVMAWRTVRDDVPPLYRGTPEGCVEWFKANVKPMEAL